MQVFICDKCGQRLTDADVENGKAVRSGTDCFCIKCARELNIAAGATPAEGASRKTAGKKPRPKTAKRAPATTRYVTAARKPTFPGGAVGIFAVGSGLLIIVGLVAAVLSWSGGSESPERGGVASFTAAKNRPKLLPHPPQQQPGDASAWRPDEDKPPPPPQWALELQRTGGTAQTPQETSPKTPAGAPGDIPRQEPASGETEPAEDPVAEISLREPYLAARKEFADKLRERDYKAAAAIIGEMTEDPAYADAAGLLKADRADSELLVEFMRCVAENLKQMVGQAIQIRGVPARLVSTNGLDVTLSMHGATVMQSAARFSSEDIMAVFSARPPADAVQNLEMRAAFWLAEGKFDEARRVIGNVQLPTAYAESLGQRLLLLEEPLSVVAAVQGPSVPVGKLVTATGAVYCRAAREAAWKKIDAGAEITSADGIDTRAAQAIFEFRDGIRVCLNTGTVARFELQEAVKRVLVDAGEIYVEEKAENMEIVTPSGTIRYGQGKSAEK